MKTVYSELLEELALLRPEECHHSYTREQEAYDKLERFLTSPINYMVETGRTGKR